LSAEQSKATACRTIWLWQLTSGKMRGKLVSCRSLLAGSQGLLTGPGKQGGSKVRMWLLLILFVCLAGALYLGLGTPGFGEKTAALVSELEDL